MTTQHREIRLASRPSGTPRLDDLELVETTVPRPSDGQILVRNSWMSVDPYMRGRMDDRPSYIEPFRIGEPLEGSAVGTVVESRADGIEVGATVSHFLGWREYAALDAAAATVVDTAQVPAEVYLGPLGATGLTAYVTVTEIAPVRAGDVVFVSAAAGAVGSVAGQLARILGAARVIGSAGGPEKAKKLVTDFGFDAAIDYKARPVADQLTELAPDGIDVYVDNVGGDQLEAALGAIRLNGRIGLVGSISDYNATTPVPGPANLYLARAYDVTLRGMLVSNHLDKFPAYLEKAAGWLRDGRLHTEQTVYDGLDQAPAAFLGVLSGANTGKMLVRL